MNRVTIEIGYIPRAWLVEVCRMAASVLTSVLFEVFLASEDVVAVLALAMLAGSCNSAFVVMAK